MLGYTRGKTRWGRVGGFQEFPAGGGETAGAGEIAGAGEN